MTALAQLPPLADVFAFSSPDPGSRAEVERRLAAEARFGAPSHPGGDWLVASAPFPGAAGEDDRLRASDLAFAQGSELFGDRERLEDLAATIRDAGDLARHPGDFGLLAFDGPAATAVRSCGGLVPMWIWSAGGEAAASTNLTVLLRALPERPPVDPLVAAMWGSTAWHFPHRRSPYAGIEIVPMGHAARWSPGGGWRLRRYWDPRDGADRSAHTEAELAAELRALLLSGLRGSLADDATNLLTLSGGVDSSALAAVTGRSLGLPLATLSWIPPPSSPQVHARDRGYVDRANAHAGVGRTFVYEFDQGRLDRMRERRPAVAIPTAHPALLALPEVLEQGPIAVLFGGEFADDVCGSWWRIHDWIDATSPSRLIRDVGRLPYDRGDLLRWPKWRLRSRLGRPRVPISDDLLPMFAAPLREAFRGWRREMERAVAGDRHPNRYFAAQLRLNSDAALATNWEILAPLGIRRAFPFHTREMLEHAATADIRKMMGPGPKRTLRAALASDVPADLLLRADKGHWGSSMTSRPEHRPPMDPATVRDLLDPGWNPGADGVTAPERNALCYLSQIRSAG